MAQKYFIEHFFAPSGLTTMESRLVDIARGAIHCVYDQPSLEAFADYLRKQQDLYLSQNKRCKPVKITLHFSDGKPFGAGTGMSIGRMSIMISDVEKEILGGGQSMSVNEIIMESLESRIRKISDAAWSLVKQVDKYTSEAGYRWELLAANEQLKKVLRE